MTFANAQQTRFLVGSLVGSLYSKGFSAKWDTDMLDITSHANAAKVFMLGRETSSLSADLMFDTDTTANGEADTLGDWKAAAALPVTFGPAGLVRGSQVMMMSALEASFSVDSQVSGIVMSKVAGQVDGFLDMGVTLDDVVAIATDTSGVAVDGGAASANGGVAHIHVSAFAGLTSDVVIIEHSVDGATSWATLVTFATVTGQTSERVVVAPGTTVRRYLRASDDVTGTGTCTRSVSFARR